MPDWLMFSEELAKRCDVNIYYRRTGNSRSLSIAGFRLLRARRAGTREHSSRYHCATSFFRENITNIFFFCILYVTQKKGGSN